MYPNRIDDATYGRFYEVKEGVFFPSVSTVSSYGTPLSYGLMKYIIKQADGDYDKYLKQSTQATDIGSLAHEYAEKLLQGESITVDGMYNGRRVPIDPVQRAVISFLEFYLKYKPRVLETEHLLYTLKKQKGQYLLPVAGRCDLVAYIDDDLWMIDFKTSKNANNPQFGIQLTLYAWIWNLNNPQTQIDRLGVVHLKKDFTGYKPGTRFRSLIEYTYDTNLAQSVYTVFNKFFDGYVKGTSIPKTKTKLPLTFNIEEYINEAEPCTAS